MRKSVMLVPVVMLLLVALTSNAAQKSGMSQDAYDQFFYGVQGNWHGIPAATPTGPWTNLLNVSIYHVLPPSAGPTGEKKWVLIHEMDDFAVRNSSQQFWSNFNAATGEGNMTYCAKIAGWTKPVSPSMVNLPFTLQSVTATSASWIFNETSPLPYPFTAEWTVSLINGSNGEPMLHSLVMLGGATHLDATMSRSPVQVPPSKRTLLELQGECPLDHQEQKKEKGVENEKQQPPQPGDKEAGSHPNRSPRPVCPLGFTKGTPPAFVLERQRQRNREKEEHNKHSITEKKGEKVHEKSVLRGPPSPGQQKLSVAPNGKTYENCYLVNPAMDLRVRWNWRNPAHSGNGIVNKILPNATVEVLVSAKVASPSHYIALGFYPFWPRMQGMDIALGFADPVTGAGCPVQSLYAKEKFGPPVRNSLQVLENSTTWLETVTSNTTTGEQETILWMQFTKRSDTGHRPLDLWYFPFFNLGEELAFAEGPVFNGVNSYCSSAIPGYHGTGHRGVRGFDWGTPENIPEYMRCDRN